MSIKRTMLALGLAGAAIGGCKGATAPESSINISGSYVLESVSGRGPATGTLLLTRAGYAERRVRFRDAKGDLSSEYLSRGKATVLDDGTIVLELRDMSMSADVPWTASASLTLNGVRLAHPDAIEGPDIVEIYRRK